LIAPATRFSDIDGTVNSVVLALTNPQDDLREWLFGPGTASGITYTLSGDQLAPTRTGRSRRQPDQWRRGRLRHHHLRRHGRVGRPAGDDQLRWHRINTVGAAAPDILGVTPGSDSGVAGDNITTYTTPAIGGVAEARALVALFHAADPTVLLGFAVAQDMAGNDSAVSRSLPVSIVAADLPPLRVTPG
jgi:hypothetical protein